MAKFVYKSVPIEGKRLSKGGVPLIEKAFDTTTGEKINKHRKVLRQICEGTYNRDKEPAIFAVGPVGLLESRSREVGVQFFASCLVRVAADAR